MVILLFAIGVLFVLKRMRIIMKIFAMNRKHQRLPDGQASYGSGQFTFSLAETKMDVGRKKYDDHKVSIFSGVSLHFATIYPCY